MIRKGSSAEVLHHSRTKKYLAGTHKHSLTISRTRLACMLPLLYKLFAHSGTESVGIVRRALPSNAWCAISSGILTRGDTINLYEALHKHKNRYSTIANTPTTILVSSRGTRLKLERGLTEPLESFDKTPVVLVLPETCRALLERAPQFPSADLVVKADREQEHWNDFKQVCLLGYRYLSVGQAQSRASARLFILHTNTHMPARTSSYLQIELR